MDWIKQNKSFCVLIAISIIWCSGAIWLIWPKIYLDIFYLDMDLNELGDYLAGVFSPLAFLWLIYGYLMQNTELRNNTLESKKAHDLANNQLNFQIKVSDQKNRIEHNNSQPNIYIKNITVNSKYPNGQSIISFKLINSGKEIRDFEIYNGEEKLTTSPIIEVLTKEKEISFLTEFTEPTFHQNFKSDILLELRIVFIDSLHNKQSTTFKMAALLNDDKLGYYATIEPTYIINHGYLYDN